jgi:hypothetical protein
MVMKKVLVLIVILAMAVGGCAAVNSALNSDPVTYICSGTEGKLTAADMLKVLETGKAIYEGGFTAIDVATAISVLTVVRDTGCFVVAELKAAFKVVDAANAAVASSQLKKLKGAAPAMPEYAPLRKFVK